ncbi:MAG: Gfo/Idh/MocA family oxidoreductase [Planctomycetota bacterium]
MTSSSGEKVPVAVFGAGHLGKFHARIYAANPRAELVCVVDRDIERARTLANELGCEALTPDADVTGRVRAASVVVSTPAHADVAVPLLEKGVACLVEKPLAGNLEDADRIIAAARTGGAALTVGHVERFQPGLRRVREMQLRPRYIECHRLAPFTFRSTEVGVVHDLMIHDLDLVLDLVGSDVAEFDAVGGSILTPYEDLASVRMVFENGARANVTSSRVSLKPMRRFRMFASDSYVSLDFHTNSGLMVRKGPNFDRAKLAEFANATGEPRGDMVDEGLLGVEELELGGRERPLQAELDHFLACVQSGTEPEVRGEDGRRALALAERIVERVRSQSW